MRQRPWFFVALALLVGCVPAAAAPTVYLAGELPESDLIALSVATAAGDPDAVLLLDSAFAEATIKPFLKKLKPGRIVPVGAFPEDHEAERRWGVKASPASSKAIGDLIRALCPKAGRIVAAPPESPGALLQAACLAGTLKCPLVVLNGKEALDPWLKDGAVQEVIAVGTAAEACRGRTGIKVTHLADEADVAKAQRRELSRAGPIRSLVLANPFKLKRTAVLAPWVAVRSRSALLLTNKDGSDADALVKKALKDDALRQVEYLTIVGGEREVPMVRRPNPLDGKDEFIEMEPGTPEGNDAFTLATGRLFHDDRAVIPLMLARQRFLDAAKGPRRALVVSNPDDDLPLLETFSRHTVKEFANAGYRVTSRFGETTNRDELRRLLPEHDIFLWEGHRSTLSKDFGMPCWDEPLPPSLVFLQSCLVLTEGEAGPLLARGSVAVVGASTRTYSASGGAFSLAFFDALLYEDQSLGGALRQAKNFLACYADLKGKRLGNGAKLEGANRRSAWAFTLWGDPALKLPKPPAPKKALPPLKHAVKDGVITLQIPECRYPTVERPPYRARLWPNGRLAGLLRSTGEDDRRLVPLAFAEVSLPVCKSAPRLKTELPDANWVFKWDERRRVGYLLAVPRAGDLGKALAFEVEADVKSR